LTKLCQYAADLHEQMHTLKFDYGICLKGDVTDCNLSLPFTTDLATDFPSRTFLTQTLQTKKMSASEMPLHT